MWSSCSRCELWRPGEAPASSNPCQPPPGALPPSPTHSSIHPPLQPMPHPPTPSIHASFAHPFNPCLILPSIYPPIQHIHVGRVSPIHAKPLGRV
eukprot:239863-Chlamydomonas_euryale.AAC.2